jgi:hypothetical protein
MKGRTIKSIGIAVSMLCFFSFFSFHLLSIDNEVIQQDFLQAFFGRPGCGATLLSKNIGRFYEMELALCLRHGMRLGEGVLHQPVEGFSLRLTFYPMLQLPFVDAAGNERTASIGEIEIDVLAGSFAVECKAVQKPETYEEKSFDQFFRQKLFLWWCTVVQAALELKDGEDGSVGVFDQVFLSRGRSRLLLKGPYTHEEGTQISASWIQKQEDKKLFLDSWRRLFKYLARKRHIVFYKYKVPDELLNKFKCAGYDVHDQIDFERCCASA